MKKVFSIWVTLLVFLVAQLPLAAIYAAPTTPNLISNPSVETASSQATSAPQNWDQGNWGTNTAAFSYLNTGEDGSHSVEVQLSNYSSGDAKWYFAPVSVQPNTAYTFSDYYQSNIPSYLVAQYTDAAGNNTYSNPVTVPASASWQNVSTTLTTPANTATMTVFHLIEANGSLTTDNYSLQAAAPAAVPPTVGMAAPLANASVSGTVPLSANASDASGISSVQFSVDGSKVGTPVTTSPYQTNWNSTTVANGTHTVTATAIDANGLSTTSAPVTITVNNPVPAGTNLIANPSLETASTTNAALPASWQSNAWGTNTTTFSYLKTGHTGSHSVSVQTTKYTSGDAKWFFNPVAVTANQTYSFSDYYKGTIASEVDVAFTMSDGSTQYLYLGAPATATAWTQYTASFTAPVGAQSATVYHLIAGVGTLTVDDASLTATTVPAVSITAPGASATLTGNVQLSANASDNSGVGNIQFKLDGQSIGAPVTSAPYQTTWNSASVTNGAHVLTAVATNVGGQSTTSAPVTIEIANANPAGGNLIPNPSMETANPTNAAMPQDWQSNAWGTNTTTFSYLKTGHTGSRSVQVKTTKYTDGDAKWFFTPQPVIPDTQYQFSDYYKSTTATEIDVAFGMSDGSTVYQIIGLPDTNSAWTKFTTDFSVPQGAQNMTVYHLIHSVGTLTLDDESLQAYTPVGFNRPLVTLTFDDGYDNDYTQVLPLLQKYAFDATEFIITQDVGTTGYMTSSQVKSLYQNGIEIGSHTVTHDDMLTETAAQNTTELSQSQTQLEAWTGAPVTDMAFPNGLYNSAITTKTKKYYSGARGVEDGLNSKDNFNPYDIKVQNVYNTTTTAQIADWVAQAQATNTWLVLVYHSVDPDVNSAIDGGIYNVTPTQLDAQLAAIKATGVPVVTMQQALAEINPQL